MKAIILLFVLVFSSIAFASTFWVVGKNYVAQWEEGKEAPTLTQEIEPASWAWNASSCQLWVEDDLANELRTFSKEGSTTPEIPTGTLLSDVSNGRFFTRSESNEQLEIRDAKGTVTQSLDREWVEFTTQVIATKSGGWALNAHEDERVIWLGQLNTNFEQAKSEVVSVGAVVWSYQKLIWDPAKKNLWLGITVSNPKAPYSPRMERRDETGKLLDTLDWPEKGIMLDMCLQQDGSLLVSRDVPTDPYTAPLFSYLEKWAPNEKSQQTYTEQVNWLVDGLICEADQITMVQHALFSSGGSRIVQWDRKAEKGVVRAKLPDRPNAIYHCPKP